MCEVYKYMYMFYEKITLLLYRRPSTLEHFLWNCSFLEITKLVALLLLDLPTNILSYIPFPHTVCTRKHFVQLFKTSVWYCSMTSGIKRNRVYPKEKTIAVTVRWPSN